MTLDDFLGPYQGGEQGFGRRTGRRSAPRAAMPLSRFWSPSDALSRQPWFGFPGGQQGWLDWRRTGQLPLQAGETTPRQLTAEQTDFYYKLPSGGGKSSELPGSPRTEIMGSVAPSYVRTTPPDPTMGRPRT